MVQAQNPSIVTLLRVPALWTVFIALLVSVASAAAALPKRLVLLVDGVAHRDMVALQQGVTYRDGKGREFTRRAFDKDFFPVSRLVSTFPSASDVAWTEILGNRPLPGYQRTYFCRATGKELYQNGVTTTMEYEAQMHWQLENGTVRAIGYVHPQSIFKREVREAIESFLKSDIIGDTFYALIRASDDAQHTKGDILAMLDYLDGELAELSALYLERENRKLEILLLSDHGNNHAGAGKRADLRGFLDEHGYEVSEVIRNARDVVLPTVGIQNWVEVHCAPAEVEKLSALLATAEGVDVLTARLTPKTTEFLVFNSKQERAVIDWDSARNVFRYRPVQDDPLDYRKVNELLAQQGKLDADGFATTEAWHHATMTHRYPLAPERIVRGHTRLALNTAPILIALKNGYIHSSWTLKQLTGLMRMGGTHGGLDDLCSNGILLSNFVPTEDTCTTQVAGLFDGFPGLRNHREGTDGAEWTYAAIESLATVPRSCANLLHAQQGERPLLRVWTPAFASLPAGTPLEITIGSASRYTTPHIRRGDPLPHDESRQTFELNHPLKIAVPCASERLYHPPENLRLEPGKMYRMSGSIPEGRNSRRIFEFTFAVDDRGLPVFQ